VAYYFTASKSRKTVDISKLTPVIALDGAPVITYLHCAENLVAVRLIRVVYVEATSSDAGVKIKVGKIGFPDYFADFTSEISKAVGDITTVTKFDNRIFLAANEVLTVNCNGFKTGLGAVIVQVEMEEYR
jgi:hypothetical protein